MAVNRRLKHFRDLLELVRSAFHRQALLLLPVYYRPLSDVIFNGYF